MFRSFQIGKAFGIPLFLHSTFFLLPLYALALSWSQGLDGILFTEAVLFTVFGCVLLHELGHALMARYFGITTRDITLYPIGGVARLESTGGKPHEEIAIALAGPAVNLVIVLLLAPVVLLLVFGGLVQGPDQALTPEGGGWLPLAGAFLLTVGLCNGGLLLFNLVPAFPMDGGRVLRAVLALGMPRLRATEIAAKVGLVLACILGLVGLLKWIPGLLLVSVFVALFGQMELHALRRQETRQRMPILDAEPVEPILEPTTSPLFAQVVVPPSRPFTGLAWDRQRGVWVRWIDGVPLD
jgi:Zn-dependent protease